MGTGVLTGARATGAMATGGAAFFAGVVGFLAEGSFAGASAGVAPFFCFAPFPLAAAGSVFLAGDFLPGLVPSVEGFFAMVSLSSWRGSAVRPSRWDTPLTSVLSDIECLRLVPFCKGIADGWVRKGAGPSNNALSFHFRRRRKQIA